MTDPFKQFGGRQTSQFGLDTKDLSKSDPFAAFGGKIVAEEDAIQKEIEQRGILDRPKIFGQEIKDEELKKIADKYDTSVEDLRSALPFLGGMPENVGVADVLKGIGGFVGEAVTLGIPQKLYRMAQDPKQEAALDELKNLVSGRKSFLQVGAEFVAPFAGAAKIAKAAGGGIKGALATGAAAGAAGGFAQSQAGEEVTGAVVGAGLGAGLAGAVGGAVKLKEGIQTKLSRKLLKFEEEAISKLNYDKYEQEALKQLQEPGSKLTEDLVMGKITPGKLNLSDMNLVLKERYTPEELASLLKEGPDNKLFSRMDKQLVDNIGFEFAAKKTLLSDIVNEKRSEVIQEVINKSVREPQAISREWEKILDQGNIEDVLKDLRLTDKIKKLMEVDGVYDYSPESKLGELAAKLSDTKFHFRTIDEKWKADTEGLLNKVSEGRNMMSIVRNAHKQDIEKLDELATQGGIRNSSKNGKIVDIVEGTVDNVTGKEREVADEVTKLFDKYYELFTTGVEKLGIKGLNIPKVKDYIPRMTKEVPEVLATIELELVKAAREASSLTGKGYRNLSDVSAEDFEKIKNLPSVRNLQEYANWVSNADVVTKTGADLATVIRKSLSSDSEASRLLDKVARSSMERVATDRPIPRFIREKDIYKILDRYSQDMLSTLYQREPLRKLKSVADVIKARGGKQEAAYIERVIEDTLGTRKGTVAHFMRDVKGQVARTLNPKIEAARESGNTTAEFVYTTMKEMVDLPAFLSNQIYPNLLGWRPVPILTNLAGGLARAAPELGGTYGYATYIRSLVWARQNWSSGAKELIDKGYVPGQWSRTGQKALADGIRASGLVNLPVSALEKLNNVGMALYTKSEELNRISLLGMSKMMADDLAKGSAMAQKSLSKFPSSVQRAVARAKSQSEVEDVLMRHMNSTIAFNYNRPSLYEFGRTLGPMFATFAKWPTAIAGEIITEYRTKPMTAATRRVAERYAAPVLAFAAIDYMLKDRLEEDERLQKLIGKSGITKAAPITSVAAVTRGDIFTPPAIDTIVKDIITPITRAEGLAIAKGLDRSAFVYAPGAGFVRFITEDLPTVITGERPKGSTQTERSLKNLGVIK